MAISYMFNSKEPGMLIKNSLKNEKISSYNPKLPFNIFISSVIYSFHTFAGVLGYIGNRLFTYPDSEVDFVDDSQNISELEHNMSEVDLNEISSEKFHQFLFKRLEAVKNESE